MGLNTVDDNNLIAILKKCKTTWCLIEEMRQPTQASLTKLAFIHLCRNVSNVTTHATEGFSQQAATVSTRMWFVNPDSQGLEFLQRGIRREDVKEADHL